MKKFIFTLLFGSLFTLAANAQTANIVVTNYNSCGGWIEVYTNPFGACTHSYNTAVDIPSDGDYTNGPASHTYSVSGLDVDFISKLVFNDGYGNTYTINVCQTGMQTYANSYCASFTSNGSYIDLDTDQTCNCMARGNTLFVTITRQP